jgi:hypothetical protein
MKYFANFPMLSYNNTLSRNLLTRVKVDEGATYYPYVMDEQRKIEHIAYDYYNDIDDVWILHHINNTIDPYYDYSLNEYDFNSYIEKKYGTIQKAKTNIMFYHNNYYNDETTKDASTYLGLSSNLKKYWTPTLDLIGNPYEYSRAKIDIKVVTNKIVSANITLNTSTSFSLGEKVTQTVSGATGFVSFSNTTTLTLQHITGTFGTYNITGNDSGASATTSDASISKQVIPVNEEDYFSAITCYDYELDLNIKKKKINVLDRSYVETVSSQFRQLLQNG